MSISQFVITNAGAELLAQAAIDGELTITRGAAGKGFLAADLSETTCTALIDPVCDMIVDKPGCTDDTISLTAQFSNLSGESSYYAGFSLAEMGLFAKLDAGAETLLCYANARDVQYADFIPGDSLREFACTFTINFTGADQLTVTTASSIIYVARSEFTALLESLQAEVDAKLPLTGGTLTGALVAGGDFALATGQVRNITIANAAPTGGVNGDVWIRYA